MNKCLKYLLLSVFAATNCFGMLGCREDTSTQTTSSSNQHCEDSTCPDGQICIGGICQDDPDSLIPEQDNPKCGDKKCTGNETCESCPKDCGKCTDPITCGDNACNGDETCESCPKDCGKCSNSVTCGDNACNGDETCESCPKDCGECDDTPICGDNACTGLESCESCPKDCGECTNLEFCGDNDCNNDETCESCPKDCGKCPEICGNNQCLDDETCESCPQDCGKCPEICGNNQCLDGETCESCPQDCGECEYCGDGICQPDETYENCKIDCLSLHPCANGCPNKAVFLYTGTPYNNNNYDFTSEEIDNFGLTHFVLCPSTNYKTWGYGNSEHRFPELIAQMVSAVNVIIQSTNGENKRVWIGTPISQYGFDIKEAGGDNPKYTAKEFFDIHREMYLKYIDDLREALGPEIWNKHVEGIYMHSEDVFGVEIKQPYTTASALLSTNSHVKLFYDVSQYVHKSYTSGSKTWNAVKFLWSPFYHLPNAWEVTQKVELMGAIANTLDIFDDVIIQLGHYEHNLPLNMELIKDGTYKNVVYNRKKKIAGGSKTSKTRIGVQMEFSREMFTNSEKKKRYYESEAYFNNEKYVIQGYDKNNYLFSYYFDAKSEVLAESQEVMRKFFDVIPF